MAVSCNFLTEEPQLTAIIVLIINYNYEIQQTTYNTLHSGNRHSHIHSDEYIQQQSHCGTSEFLINKPWEKEIHIVNSDYMKHYLYSITGFYKELP